MTKETIAALILMIITYLFIVFVTLDRLIRFLGIGALVL
jgi:hypothetical protein